MATLTDVIPRLPVKDLRRTIDFYTRHLGFAIDVTWPEENPTFAILCRDTTSLGFFEPNEHHGPIGYAELYVQVTDSRREFAFRDPDGYLIILTEPVS